MIRKLIVLGVDGMDRDVVCRLGDRLPNLKALMCKNGFPRLRSTFPADTTPAWSTVYTGLDPSEHGILNFINPGAQADAYQPLHFDDSAFRGRCFWDVLNREGMTCAVVLPMNIRQGWPINGLMITRPDGGDIHVYPENRRDFYRPRAEILSTEGSFVPERNLNALKLQYAARLEEEMRLTRLAVQHEEADVLFAYFSSIDGVQHDFWRHFDESHPEYPGPNAYGSAIPDMYMRMDKFIAALMELQPETALLVVSDHGHGPRPLRSVRINELLRRNGFLSPAGRERASQQRAKARLRSFAVQAVRRCGMPGWALRLAKRFPLWKRIFVSGRDFDWAKTQACLSDLSAVKNYSYGGIRISSHVADKDALADEIIARLSELQCEDGSGPLFQWIARTNTIYSGPFLYRYPEIIYQMDERYGGEWSLGENIFEKSAGMHSISPGGHRWRSAVLAANALDFSRSQYEMTDICGMILDAARGRRHV